MREIKKKNYNLLSNIIYVFKGVMEHKPYMLWLMGGSIICTIGTRFVWLYLSKYIIEYIAKGISLNQLIKMVLILTSINIICGIGQNAVNCWKEAGALYVRPMFMLRRNKKHMDMLYENLEYDEVYEMIQKAKNATSWTEKGIEGIIRFSITFFSDLFTCIVAMIIICIANPLMVIVVVLVGILYFLLIDFASKKEKYYTEDSVNYELRKNTYFNQVTRDFNFGKDIRLYDCQEALIKEQYNANRVMHKRVCKSRNIWTGTDILTAFLEFIREGIMYIVLIISIINKGMGIGDFTLYMGCVRNSAQAFQAVLTIYARMRQCSREVNDYRTFNEFCDEERSVGTPVEPSNEYKIEFKNVSFKYPSANCFALNNMSITIEPHEKLAVVGLNGAGKTTFIKLLMGLYTPTSGNIYLNGRDISEYDKSSYYKLFSPVFQDMECYGFTLAENVSMKPDTDRELAEKSLRSAGLGNKLDEWEKGLDTPILKILHRDGILLSGGEKQKLSLARALYKNGPLVVLDEPTASLDAMAESQLYEDFDKLIENKSAIYISHRLASTRFCDKIALFDEGRLVEYGSHEDLMNANGKYAEMFQMQSQYYRG